MFIVKKYLSILSKGPEDINFYKLPYKDDVFIFNDQLQAFEFLKTHLKIDDGFLMINSSHIYIYKITLNHCDHFATITRVMTLDEQTKTMSFSEEKNQKMIKYMEDNT